MLHSRDDQNPEYNADKTPQPTSETMFVFLQPS